MSITLPAVQLMLPRCCVISWVLWRLRWWKLCFRLIASVTSHCIFSGCVVVVILSGIMTGVAAMIISNVVSMRVTVVPICVSFNCARRVFWLRVVILLCVISTPSSAASAASSASAAAALILISGIIRRCALLRWWEALLLLWLWWWALHLQIKPWWRWWRKGEVIREARRKNNLLSMIPESRGECVRHNLLFFVLLGRESKVK